jgi:hypothetical protein
VTFQAGTNEDIMENRTAALKDGQAPARRIGVIIAMLVICIGCACLAGGWYLFAREGIDSLAKSISLTGNGVRTTGTVTSVEEFTSASASFPSTSYKLIVSFDVDGETYSVISNAYYQPTGKSWVGETMPIIYDPENPKTALIDTFQERWVEPIVNSAP